jgi:phage gp16-like protein
MRTRPTAEEQRKRELAQIHIAKTQLGLDDDTYRDMLFNVAGVRSSRDLTTTGRLRVLQHFEEKGWKKKGPARTQCGKSPTTALDKEALMGKIAALLTEMALPWAYANGISQQMKFEQRVDWCTPQQLHKIVAALMYKARKQNA